MARLLGEPHEVRRHRDCLAEPLVEPIRDPRQRVRVSKYHTMLPFRPWDVRRDEREDIWINELGMQAAGDGNLTRTEFTQIFYHTSIGSMG